MSDVQEQKLNGLTIRILRDQCIGSGNCAKVAPDLFELDDSNIIAFVNGASADDRDRAVEACNVCPVDALVAIDERGNQLAPQDES